MEQEIHGLWFIANNLPQLKEAETKLLLVLVTASYAQPGKWRTLKRSYFVKATGLTEKSVTAGLKKLKAAGLIETLEGKSKTPMLRVKYGKSKQKCKMQTTENNDSYSKNEVESTPKSNNKKDEVESTLKDQVESTSYNYVLDLILNSINSTEEQQNLLCVCRLVDSEIRCDEKTLDHQRKIGYKCIFCERFLKVFILHEKIQAQKRPIDDFNAFAKASFKNGWHNAELMTWLNKNKFTVEATKQTLENFEAMREEIENSEQMKKENENVVPTEANWQPSYGVLPRSGIRDYGALRQRFENMRYGNKPTEIVVQVVPNEQKEVLK